MKTAVSDAAAAWMVVDLAYIQALCECAIAQAWDCGRLSYASQGTLPFQDEVYSLLRPKQGQAPEPLAAALAHLKACRAKRSPYPSPARAEAPLSPLDELTVAFGLSPQARDILLLAAAPSLRGEFARLYGIVSNDPDRPLVDEFLLCQLLGLSQSHRVLVARELDHAAPLLRYGLVAASEGARPFAALSVDPLILRRLQGDLLRVADVGSHLALQSTVLPLQAVTAPSQLIAALRSTLRNNPRPGLRIVLRGKLGSGRRTLLAAAAAELGFPVGVLDLTQLAPFDGQFSSRLEAALREALLRDWWPCVDGLELIATKSFNEQSELRERTRQVLRAHPGILLFRLDAGAEPLLFPGYHLFDLPVLSESARIRAFREALKRSSLPTHGIAESLASRHRVGMGIITRVTASVASAQRGPQPPPGELELQLEQALRQHRGTRMGGIASLVTRLATWDTVVLPEEVRDSVLEFIGRARYRRTVFETWGMEKILTSARGLTALFEGGPGTGKSMVAGLIARELGYELYRVDLSRILSKWIGETEQNLAKVFDVAEDGQVILLFDEADALFSKRTEVSTSVDRYANAEVNYLLQRLDSFEGIAILTTNLEKSIDTAFKRRISLRLVFPFPDEEMREELWRVHLPPGLPVVGPLDFTDLARTFELSGGYIRNAVLRAAFLAAMDGTPLTQSHLVRAVRLEYRERGKLYEGGVLE